MTFTQYKKNPKRPAKRKKSPKVSLTKKEHPKGGRLQHIGYINSAAMQDFELQEYQSVLVSYSAESNALKLEFDIEKDPSKVILHAQIVNGAKKSGRIFCLTGAFKEFDIQLNSDSATMDFEKLKSPNVFQIDLSEITVRVAANG